VPVVKRRALLTSVGAIAAALCVHSGLGFARAASARTIDLRDVARLRLTSKHGFTLNERGAATGTIGGVIYVHLTIVSTSRVEAEINLYPRTGSISGYASAAYHRGGETGSFAGSMSITRGTGDYSHASGSGLSFSGTIQRSNYAIDVQVSGRAVD
jgi:hypothetical protein